MAHIIDFRDARLNKQLTEIALKAATRPTKAKKAAQRRDDVRAKAKAAL